LAAHAGRRHTLAPLDLVRLTPLMNRTSGSRDVIIGLIDGPVALAHPALANQHVREIPQDWGGTCTQISSSACQHGTFVAGILSAQRGSVAPAICPNCILLLRPIFAEGAASSGEMPSAKPGELAQAILDCIDAGARVLNISSALGQPSIKEERALAQALDQAARQGVIVIVAAGNQGTLGSTAITRHPWVVPVVGYDLQGRPMTLSNFGNSIGRQGLGAPGVGITSLGTGGEPLTSGGTSAAAPFVTGAVALLWSEFPNTHAVSIKLAITRPNSARRKTVVPPLMDAWVSHQFLVSTNAGRDRHDYQ
jgi:subtilisin family serine protease